VRTSRTASAIAVAALTLTSLVGTAVSADAAVPARYKNCTNLQKTFKHGVGRSTARDHTSGKPVTTFTHNTKEYTKAVKANRSLDRDKDGIACEKR
jgi:hypothetical protein